MDKKKYTAPEMEITEFDTEDVITGSDPEMPEVPAHPTDPANPTNP